MTEPRYIRDQRGLAALNPRNHDWCQPPPLGGCQHGADDCPRREPEPVGPVRQFHVTVYAKVDESNQIVGWEICEPDAVPEDGLYSIWNVQMEKWECVRSNDDEGVYNEIEHRLQLALEAMVRR